MTRTVDGPLTSLVKAVDAAIAENSKLKSFVVYVTDDATGGAKQLESLAQKAGVKNVPLTIFDDLKGPEGYDIAKEADVTIMMWSGSKVKVNYAFAKGGFTEAEAEKVIAEVKRFS